MYKTVRFILNAAQLSYAQFHIVFSPKIYCQGAPQFSKNFAANSRNISGFTIHLGCLYLFVACFHLASEGSFKDTEKLMLIEQCPGPCSRCDHTQ